jgi:hypothetical protein
MAAVREDDPERAMLAAVLNCWARVIGTSYVQRYTLTGLVVMIGREDCDPELRAAIQATAPYGKVDARGLGHWLRRYKGRVVGDLYLCNKPDKHGHGAQWWVDSTQYPTGPSQG